MVADILTSLQTTGRDLAVLRTILMEGHAAGLRMADEVKMDRGGFPVIITG